MPRPKGPPTPWTQDQMVLVALYRASRGTTNKVAYEEIVLQAWRDYPSHFSLRNHPEHPDGSDIHKRLYSSLKSKRLVVSVGNKFFRLTEAGVQAAGRAVDGVAAPRTADEPVRISREEEAFLRHAKGTRAYAAAAADRLGDLVDYDARLFFRFSTATPREERARRVQFALKAINNCRQAGYPEAVHLARAAEALLDEFHDQLGVGVDHAT